jgi:hypothetical protein
VWKEPRVDPNCGNCTGSRGNGMRGSEEERSDAVSQWCRYDKRQSVCQCEDMGDMLGLDERYREARHAAGRAPMRRPEEDSA